MVMMMMSMMMMMDDDVHDGDDGEDEEEDDDDEEEDEGLARLILTESLQCLGQKQYQEQKMQSYRSLKLKPSSA